MATIQRRRRSSRLHLSVYKRFELLTGIVPNVVSGYTGYATGTSRNLADYISDQMRADWAANRAALMEYWESGMNDSEAFPDDSLPWLCFGPRDRPPWACEHLD